MKALVTGASGFLGSALTRRLVERGHTVYVLRRPTSRLDLLGDSADHVEHRIGDILDSDSLLAAMEGVEVVYHTAAFVGFGPGNRDLLYRINVEGTRNVVNAALTSGIKRLVVTSSMAAFGRPEVATDPIDENAQWHASKNNSPYARSKHLAELEVFRGIGEGLDAVIVNPALIFGPGRPGENTRLIIDAIRQRKVPAFPPGGTNVVDVLDVANGHIAAMGSGRTGERYFLGSENLSWQAIMAELASAFDVPAPTRKAPARLMIFMALLSEAYGGLLRTQPRLTMDTARSAIHFYRYDNRKAVEELGCSFRPFRDTARRIAEVLSDV